MKSPNKKAKKRRIPRSTIRRLSIYYRTLNIVEKRGAETISSKELADIEGVNASQVRRDLSLFGSFGCRGIGYNVTALKKHLVAILGLNKRWNVVVVGAAQLGNVLVHSESLRNNNFFITKIFDKTPELFQNIYGNIKVRDLKDLEKEISSHTDHIAIIAVPPPEVQAVIDRIAKIGLRGVLYFASRAVKAPQNMVVLNQDISIDLGMLSYQLTAK